MFSDNRSKKLVMVAHCILNQNSISDNTADFPGTFREAVELLLEYDVGIVQMPCPELMCLGLDRGDVHGAERDVVVENSRIRRELSREPAAKRLKEIVSQVVYQIEEYKKSGFLILCIIGINRSPSCGVDTTSVDDMETEGKGVFMDALEKELRKRGIDIEIIGVKTSEAEKSLSRIRRLLES